MASSKPSDDLHSLASASDSSDITPIIPRKRRGNVLDILTKMQTLLMTGILVYFFYQYSCQRDGEWSNWGTWSKCNGGLRLRSRYCNSPSPSIFGQYCKGSSEQYQTCNLVSCKDGKQSLLGSEHRPSDTFIHTTELRNELLNRLSQVSQEIAKIEINLENKIKEEHIQTLVLEKMMKGDRDERLQQDTVIQKEVKTIKDEIKSDMNKAEEEHSELINEIKDDIEKLERMSLNEINSIRHSFNAFKVLTTKRLKEQWTSLSTNHSRFMQQVSTAVTPVSNDLSGFKQEITASVQEVKKQTEMSIDNVTSELLKISHKGKDHKVAFTAYGVAGTTAIIFPHVIQNNGNGYNSSTGKFTCKMPGIYYFTAQLSKEYGQKTDLVECFIYHNKSSEVGARADPNGVRAEPDNDGYSLSISGTFHLNEHDYVYIGGCTGISAVYTDNRSSFTGFLVTPDD